MADRILRIAEVCKVVQMHRSTIYKLMGNGKFPKPLRLGPQSRGWRESDIDQWIRNLQEVEIRAT